MISRYQIKDREHLELANDALKFFRGHIQPFGQNEAGGILLGCVYSNASVLIEKVTTPDNSDKAGRRFFDRSRKRAQQVVEREWQESSGVRIYLGEWHTHSEPNPSPSSRDRTMIRNMLRQTKMHIDFLFLNIVGTQSNWVGIETGTSLRRLCTLTHSQEAGHFIC